LHCSKRTRATRAAAHGRIFKYSALVRYYVLYGRRLRRLQLLVRYTGENEEVGDLNVCVSVSVATLFKAYMLCGWSCLLSVYHHLGAEIFVHDLGVSSVFLGC
jgi:hypothetical protein